MLSSVMDRSIQGIGNSGVNSYTKDDKALVSRVRDFRDLKEGILSSVELIGGFEKIMEGDSEVFLKPNFNTADPSPASSDPEFVEAIIELLYEHGASKVILGESSMASLSTREVLEKTGMLRKAQRAGAEIVVFDEGKWVKVEIGGRYLTKVSLPQRTLKVGKLVYSCCMKTHKWAKFTLSLKLAVGFMKPRERMRLHSRNLQQKIADLNLVVHPSLVIMDGRKCFISGGPAKGEVREPGVILASGDRVAIDVEAVKTMASFDGASLNNDPWIYTQITRARELGLGVTREQDYTILG
ncbi:MAG: DUF362 domain-containing protein [Candidatus Bathyarchaeota archaeon]|nr:DUF362 domain-containing protein [Candidatus Bathyarchaeota archaeon]